LRVDGFHLALKHFSGIKKQGRPLKEIIFVGVVFHRAQTMFYIEKLSLPTTFFEADERFVIGDDDLFGEGFSKPSVSETIAMYLFQPDLPAQSFHVGKEG
jgi:hypothetical protein